MSDSSLTVLVCEQGSGFRVSASGCRMRGLGIGFRFRRLGSMTRS